MEYKKPNTTYYALKKKTNGKKRSHKKTFFLDYFIHKRTIKKIIS